MTNTQVKHMQIDICNDCKLELFRNDQQNNFSTNKEMW